MADKRKIVVQLDTDPQASVFDRVVAIDAGADELFSYSGVRPEQVRDLVHGCIFTRHPRDLKCTAVFIGGSDVAAGEKLLEEARKHLLPKFNLTVSLMLDSNGSNTTAAAAVRAAATHLDLGATRAMVLGTTGPVGQRVAQLLARRCRHVRLGSRQLDRAARVCERLQSCVPGAKLEPIATGEAPALLRSLEDRELVVSAGAAGAVLFPSSARKAARSLKLAIDLNAVPPLGIDWVDAMDKGAEREGVIAYGAIGIGDTKMKVHKAAIARLFESNDQVLDIEEIYAIATTLP